MANTGFKIAGTGASVDFGTEFPVDSGVHVWTTPGNITAIDTNDAVSTTTGTTGLSYRLVASNFDFSSIPLGAHIDGYEVRVQNYFESATNWTWNHSRFDLVDTASAGYRGGGANPTDMPQPSGTEQDGTWGYPDKRNESIDDITTKQTLYLDRQLVTNSAFGASVCGLVSGVPGTETLNVDAIEMDIYYHEGFPATLGSGEQMGGGKKGPWLYNGYVYALAVRGTPGAGDAALQVVRTQTPEKGDWEELDADTTSEMVSSTNLLYGEAIAAQVISNFLHIVRIDSSGSGSRVLYRRFNLDTNTWVTTADETWVGPVDILAPAVDIHCISTSNIYVIYSGEIERVMGGDKLRVDYAHWNGTAWTTAQALDNAGDVHYGSPVICEGNGADDVHFAWLRQTSTANDPPNDWADIQGRTHLGSGGLDGTWDTFTFSSITAGGIGASMRALTRDAGTIRAYLAENTSGDLGIVLGTEGGANNVIDFTSDAQDTDTISIDVNPRGVLTEDQWVFDVMYDPITSKYYMVHSDPATDDLYYRESVGGASWSASVEILDGVTRCDDISINVYTRGIDTVLGVLYTDAAITYYTEHVVQTGILPFYGQVNDARRRNTLLRM